MTGTGSVNVDNTAGFATSGGELVLVTDGTTADLFQTSAAGGGVLTFGAGAYNTGHTKLYGLGPPPSTVAKARFVRYFIDNTTDPAHPTLMVDRNIPGQGAQPLADDIEDMQLTYGLDTNADGIVESWVAARRSQPFADPSDPAAIDSADAPPGGGLGGNTAGAGKPSWRRHGGRLPSPGLRHRGRCHGIRERDAMTISNERGSALIITLMLLLILTAIGIYAISISTTEMSTALQSKTGTATLNSAESGAHFGIDQVPNVFNYGVCRRR